MGALRWIYRRLGQIVCFSLGGFLLLIAAMATYNQITPTLLAAVLLAVALVLRHQMLNKQDTLTAWWATLSPAQQEAVNKALGK